jgi:hypothetical protein
MTERKRWRGPARSLHTLLPGTEAACSATGTAGGGGEGASCRMGPGGRIEYGRQSHSHWEDDTMVVITHTFHAGHELVVEERLRLDAGTNRLISLGRSRLICSRSRIRSIFRSRNAAACGGSGGGHICKCSSVP